MANLGIPIEYLGAIDVKEGVVYKASTIKTEFPTADMLKIKADKVRVGVGGTTLFMTSYDDETLLATDLTTTYVFSKDCVIAVGKYKGNDI